jgi:hypothetical protein
VEPGLVVEEVFRQVRRRVLEATRGEQQPWESSSLTRAFYFSSPPPVPGDGTMPPQKEEKVPPDVLTPEPRRQPPVSPVTPLPTPPPLQTGEGITGKWEGWYQCQHQEIGFSLEISNGGSNQIAAVFEFFPLPGALSIPRGSFRMAGDYNHTDGTIRLNSAGWIKRPLGFQSHDIEGQLEAHGRGISGRVLTTGCAHFTLTRK